MIRRNSKGHVIPKRHFVRGLRGSVALPLEERFWRLVDRSGGPEACWEWLGTTNHSGYGMMRVDRKTVRAHRVSFAMVHGALPPHVFVCHRCDNPPCVNPLHLFSGSVQDNVRDMVSKRRQARGSGKRGTKLDENIVRQIREAAFSGRSMHSIAVELGLSPGTIRNAILGITWRHVA